MTVKTTEGQARGSSKKTNEALHPLRLARVSARVKGGDFCCWGCGWIFNLSDGTLIRLLRGRLNHSLNKPLLNLQNDVRPCIELV